MPCAECRLLLSAIWHPMCVFFYALPAPTLCCSFLFSHFISTFTFPRSVESKSKLILLFPQQRQHHDQKNRVCAPPPTACPAAPASHLVPDPLSYADSSVCLYSCRCDKAFCHFDWRRVENGFKLHCFAVRERRLEAEAEAEAEAGIGAGAAGTHSTSVVELKCLPKTDIPKA